jgi:hypothetical protein
MMSIFLTHTLERQNQDNVIYYFCNSEDDRNSTSSAILRALIWKIMAKRPELACLVLPYFETPEGAQAMLSTPGILFELLSKLAQGSTMAPMYCIIDGLDECEKDSIRWIASRLPTLYRGTHMIKMRICVVSRDILELRHTRQILLDPDNNDKVDTDINTFTSLKMKDLTRRHNLSGDVSLQIQAQLLHKAEGTFLWIGYAVNELLTKATTMQVLEALEELPAALPALYSRMIRNIAVDKLHICISILSWVALAEQSLTLDQLADAVEWHVPSQLTPEQAAQDYISLCEPLVSIQSGKVVFVHQSVKDYLLRTQTDDDRILESARIKISESHLAIADRCLKVLGGHSALVRYANLFWPDHAKQCGRLARLWIVENYHFFRERSKSRTSWWKVHIQASERLRESLQMAQAPPNMVLPVFHPHDGLFPYSLESYPELPQLHMACLLGFTQWVENILTSRRRFMKPWKRNLHSCTDRLATPLHFAVLGHNSETVEYLLGKAADPNRRFNTMGSPFQHAIQTITLFSRGYTILERMLTCGADVNILLFTAIKSRDMGLLELAIKNNASLNLPIKVEPGRSSITSLHRAIQTCDSDNATGMVRRLLEAGADPLVQDNHHRTALSYACNPSWALGGSYFVPTKQKTVKGNLRAIVAIFEEFGYSCA